MHIQGQGLQAEYVSSHRGVVIRRPAPSRYDILYEP